MNRAINCGTVIVLAHLLVNIIHGVAHRELHIELGPAAMLFVIGVILLCPLLAMVLLWTSQKRLDSFSPLYGGFIPLRPLQPFCSYRSGSRW